MQAASWSIEDMPAQDGRVAIVTGASSGIGLETARALAGKGAGVTLGVRDREKGNRAADAIRASHPGAQVAVQHLDLADLASVRAFADTFQGEHRRLDLLINNAGVMMCPFATTRDGFEIQFGTNHLGHFALTGHLLPLLRATGDSRVVNVSSLAHWRGNLDFDDINWQRRAYDSSQAYCDSKLANLLFTLQLAQKMEASGDNPMVTAAHPGWTRTDLQRHVWKYRFLGLFMGQDSAMGALPTLRAATDPDALPVDYYGPSGKKEMRGPPAAAGRSERARERSAAETLWRLSEELTGVSY
ncbi:oxidoreductase [Haliea sp. E17]|uniref:oxidoreductase n=1 Tax=Haliea sp. E17 TaxID=3401576 RepID=UPI003AAF96DF